MFLNLLVHKVVILILFTELIDFNGLSAHQGLFLGLEVSQCHSVFIHIYSFCVVVSCKFLFFFGTWCYWIPIIFKWISLTDWGGRVLKCTLTQDMRGLCSNGKGGVLHNPQIFRKWATSSEAVSCYSQGNSSFLRYSII